MGNPLVINIYKTKEKYNGPDDTDNAICSVYFHWDAELEQAMSNLGILAEAIRNSIEEKDIVSNIVNKTKIKFGCTEDGLENEKDLFEKKYGVSFSYDKEEVRRRDGLLFFTNRGKREALEYALGVCQLFLKESFANVEGVCFPSDEISVKTINIKLNK